MTLVNHFGFISNYPYFPKSCSGCLSSPHRRGGMSEGQRGEVSCDKGKATIWFAQVTFVFICGICLLVVQFKILLTLNYKVLFILKNSFICFKIPIYGTGNHLTS
jgi:hypothetical protein